MPVLARCDRSGDTPSRSAKSARARSVAAQSVSAFGNPDDLEPRRTPVSVCRPTADADRADHADPADPAEGLRDLPNAMVSHDAATLRVRGSA